MRIIATVGGVVAPFVIEGILMIIQVESDWLMNMVLSIDPLGDVVLARIVRIISISVGGSSIAFLYRQSRWPPVVAAYSVVMWFVLSWYELAFGSLVYGMHL
jgi:hypothetical protein